MGLQGIIKLILAFRHDQEANVFVGFCPNLNIFSQGSTQKESEESLRSAVCLFLKHGGLSNLLKQRGLNEIEAFPMGQVAEPIAIDNFNSVANVDVPVYFKRGEVCQPCV